MYSLLLTLSLISQQAIIIGNGATALRPKQITVTAYFDNNNVIQLILLNGTDPFTPSPDPVIPKPDPFPKPDPIVPNPVPVIPPPAGKFNITLNFYYTLKDYLNHSRISRGEVALMAGAYKTARQNIDSALAGTPNFSQANAQTIIVNKTREVLGPSLSNWKVILDPILQHMERNRAFIKTTQDLNDYYGEIQMALEAAAY